MVPLLFSLALTLPSVLAQNCPIAPGVVEWRTRPDDPTRVYLYVDGRQRGGYDWAADEWRDYDGQNWGPPRTFRTPRPEHSAANFGVMRERLADEERLTIQGRPQTRLHRPDTDSLFPDDSDRLRLTIIGTEQHRQAVLNDLINVPELVEASNGMLIQAYSPNDWAVADCGFVTSGQPTIYLQAADGRVLHRQDAYPGPKRLAAALRRARPDYDPAHDPNHDRGTFSAPWRDFPPWLSVTLLLIAFLTLFRRNPR